MRSIWLAQSGGFNYIFESSFDAHKFVNRIKAFGELPEDARIARWEITEMPIRESSVDALYDYNKFYTRGNYETN